MDVEDFQARAVGIDVGKVDGVAVTQARRVEPFAVVVDHAGPVDDLVLAVAVDVADAQVVVPLAAVRPIAGSAVVAVEGPDVRERAVPPVPGGEHGPRVVAAAHDHAGPRAVEVRDGREEAVDPVAAIVAPVGRPSPGRDVPGRGQRLAGRAFEDGEELRTIEDEARVVAVIRGGIADRRPRAVDRAVGRLADDLGLAVAIEVVDHELGVMSTFPDVLARG